MTPGDFRKARSQRVNIIRRNTRNLLAEIAEVLYTWIGYLRYCYLTIQGGWPTEGGQIRAGTLGQTIIAKTKKGESQIADGAGCECICICKDELMGMKVYVSAGFGVKDIVGQVKV